MYGQKTFTIIGSLAVKGRSNAAAPRVARD
jgi:hypothetical protein